MNNGYCSLIIKGHGLNFDEIEKNIKLEVSQKFVEGDIISKAIGKNPFDLIRFDRTIGEEDTPNEKLNNLIDIIQPSSLYIKKIKQDFDVYLKCFVQSDNAQINYRISPEVLNKIANLDIDFEVSVLSWGGADEE
jgi:hypothetical protein